MAENLFEGLPPPSSASERPCNSPKRSPSPAPAPKPAPPAPALKSALKRDKPSSPPSDSHDEASGKRLRFKTTVDATETQIMEAMQKISSHIKNPSKFNKASKLAIQLIQAGSVKPTTNDQFFAILDSSMHSLSACNEPSVRADYHSLFTVAQDLSHLFSKQQSNQLATWTLHAVVANDLYTDDSFVFSKAVGKIKETISSLPIATAEDDKDEALALAADENDKNENNNNKLIENENKNEVTSDPFGLDNLLPIKLKKSEKIRGKEVAFLNKKAEEEESKRYLQLQREALLKCLDIAARRYKLPWTQTAIDILVKHAFDNKERFTKKQREAIEKLWASIKEQQIRRKQGKSVTGKLDMNAFEWLQEKYSHEKISIRHAVGGGGERRAQQWLG